MQDGPRSIKAIEDAIKSKNSDDIQLYAHRLKGAALTIGAGQLSQKAYLLECAGQQQNTGISASLLEDVRSEFEKLKSLLSNADWIEIVRQQVDSK